MKTRQTPEWSPPEDWINWIDREGTPIKLGDWITDPEGRDFEVMGQTPANTLFIETNDGKPFPRWIMNWGKIRMFLRNPILSPS